MQVSYKTKVEYVETSSYFVEYKYDRGLNWSLGTQQGPATNCTWLYLTLQLGIYRNSILISYPI